MRVLRGVVALAAGLIAATLVFAGVGWLWLEGQADEAPPWDAGEVTATPRPLRAAPTRDAKQVLFGDLHVHTSFSADAFAYALPLYQGAGARPPSDACDFARFCSQLDFWSINDHAEGLGPDQWRETTRAIRECNAAAGNPDAPDLVSFLGWEWSQSALEPAEHYGHKNVVLLETDASRVPDRPIAASTVNPVIHLGMALGSAATRDIPNEELRGLYRFLRDSFKRDVCPAGVDSRDLPAGCADVAATPDVLFEKLAQWGQPAIVIPHGLAWGVTNPVEGDLANQLEPPMHNPEWQRLIEVYSGHGTSELFSDFDRTTTDADGEPACPVATDRFEPCCARAGDLVRARCADPESAACRAEVEGVRARVAKSTQGLLGRFANANDWVPGIPVEAYGDCGQLKDAFLPAYDYRPKMSAQYGYAGAAVREDQAPAYWRLGIIGSSDNHSARPGTGFKEFGRLENTEGNARVGVESPSGSYFFTGGLAAVHATGRDRGAVFDALHRREVYGTSGERMLLWFDAIDDAGASHPMGSHDVATTTPRFEVRAVGAFAQKPGCPAFVHEALDPERLEWLCMGECFHPSDTRKPITRIEVVRIRPVLDVGASRGAGIEDPWRVFACDGNSEGCSVSFEDPDELAQETLYYARAIQAPSPAVNGNPLRCERDASGRCTRASLCPGTGAAGSRPPEDCLGPVEERAWSSPIWVRPHSESSTSP